MTYSAAQTFNVLALFLRFDNEGSSILDPLRDSAYGIYLIHYVPVLWLQYLMFGMSFGPVRSTHRDHQGRDRVRADAGLELGRYRRSP